MTRRDSTVVELMHGIAKIADPYRWLETPSSLETVDFITKQNEKFNGFIGSSNIKQKIQDKITKYYNYEKFGCPMKRGDYYYQFYNSGLLPQSILQRRRVLTDQAVTFFDPNTLSLDGTVSLSVYSFSKSGKYFACGLSASGSDWVEISVKDATLDSAPNVEDTPLKWAKFTSISWTHDDKGFFYNRYPAPGVKDAGTETDTNQFAQIYYHFLGTNQEKDAVCFSIPENPNHMPGASISDDGKYVIFTVSESCDPANKVYIGSLENFTGGSKSISLLALVETFTAQYEYLTNDGSVFYFVTTMSAPNKRVVKIDIENLDKGWVEVVPESKNVLDEYTVIDNDKLVLVYLADVKHVIQVKSLYTGSSVEPNELFLPLGSIVQSISGKREHNELFYSFSSFTTPGTIRLFNFKTKEASVLKTTFVDGLDSDLFETQQVFYKSKDGTKVPMYIVSKKGISLNSNNPTLLYGYGGFNISVTPRFSVTWLTFVQHFGGVVAVANIRGGGEYGEEWYKQGKLTNKQNVFDDFQAAANYLICNEYTQSSKLGINGGSNGGLLVGACINQAPELFGCAIADVGVMDMLRFHKFTIGHAWKSDYGDPDVKDDFEVLLKYSPLHNVQENVEYPAVLITTSDHDDRVVPLHSLKFLATLQHCLPNNCRPIMGRIETKAGHGAGKSTQQYIEEASDKFAFLSITLCAEWNE